MGQFVTGMVTVDKHPDHHGVWVRWEGWVHRVCAVELGPVIVLLKSLTIDGQVSQVKDKLGVMVGF